MATPPPSSSQVSNGPTPELSALHALLGTSLRLLLRDHRTIQGTLELIDRSSLLLSNTLETKAPPTTQAEWEVFENRDRYYPRSDSGGLHEIEGLGVAREIGAVLVGFGDVVRIEVGRGDWEGLKRGSDLIA
jgi:small nuclear ribonucleoprotein (snRNP)-like protein